MVLQGLSKSSVMLLVVNLLMAIAVFVVIVLTEINLEPNDRDEQLITREPHHVSEV